MLSKKKTKLNRIDRRILQLLQDDAARSTADIADAVGLSTTPCWRRIQNLERAGYLRRRVALLDPDVQPVAIEQRNSPATCADELRCSIATG